MAAADSQSGKVLALIMAGGSGTRFWPASTSKLPKQYLPLLGKESLIQLTVKRIERLVDSSHIHICSQSSHVPLIREQLPKLKSLILEPMGKNTAPCLMLSLLECLKKGYAADAVMVVLPADHFIENENAFTALLAQAVDFARASGGLVTFGIVPKIAHTGYGYIEAGEKAGKNAASPLKIKQFVEKPNAARAEEYLKHGSFFWNSGIFVWTLKALKAAFEAHTPELWKRLSEAHAAGNLDKVYPEITGAPIDTAVMEKAKNGYVFRMDLPWTDLGSWDALHALLAKENASNLTLSGTTEAIDSTGCLVKVSPEKKVAIVGVSDLVIVESGDKLLITHRRADQKVRDVAKRFD